MAEKKEGSCLGQNVSLKMKRTELSKGSSAFREWIVFLQLSTAKNNLLKKRKINDLWVFWQITEDYLRNIVHIVYSMNSTHWYYKEHITSTIANPMVRRTHINIDWLDCIDVDVGSWGGSVALPKLIPMVFICWSEGLWDWNGFWRRRTRENWWSEKQSQGKRGFRSTNGFKHCIVDVVSPFQLQ